MADETIEDIRERKMRDLMNSPEDSETTASPSEPVHVDGAEELQQVATDHDVVLVDFYADWCGPCQMIAPVVEDLAAETPATVAKVDIDANQALAQQYSVRGVPTLILFADGEPVEQLVGMQQKPQLRQLIDQYT
jgi:thioredoxin 1